VFADPVSGVVTVHGDEIGVFDPTSIHAGNVACALGAVVGLGFDPRRVATRLGDLPQTAHRRTVGKSDRGFTIVDDTFNSNPAGARAALDTLEHVAGQGRMALVTPGMVELGSRQYDENRSLIAEAAARGVEWLVVVGHTNRRALLDGAQEQGIGSVIVTETREEAVEWVRRNLQPGDAVLYENDLPDHYP
jgi:UDP-N-acetylmuramoyl-tripeptide--D-alanyl-D-alanine ligase